MTPVPKVHLSAVLTQNFTHFVPWNRASSRAAGRSHRADTLLVVTRVGFSIKGFCFTTSLKIIHKWACVPQQIRSISSFKSLDDRLPDSYDFRSNSHNIFNQMKRQQHLCLHIKYNRSFRGVGDTQQPIFTRMPILEQRFYQFCILLP